MIDKSFRWDLPSHNNDNQLLLIADDWPARTNYYGYFLIDSQVPGTARADPPQSLSWSADGQTLFAGYSDNLIRVWQVCYSIMHSNSSNSVS